MSRAESRTCPNCGEVFLVEHYSKKICCSLSCSVTQQWKRSPKVKPSTRDPLTDNTWRALRERCRNPNCPEYKLYGAVGIDVCERWRTYDNFLADMGTRPSRLHTIDRIDNSKGYEPGNCRWATKSQQARNRKSTKLTAEQAAEIRVRARSGESPRVLAAEFGVSRSQIEAIKSGRKWKDEVPVLPDLPPVEKQPTPTELAAREVHERGATQEAAAAMFGVTQSAVSRTIARIYRGVHQRSRHTKKAA